MQFRKPHPCKGQPNPRKGVACKTTTVGTSHQKTPVSVVDYLNRERYTAALLAKNIDHTKHEKVSTDVWVFILYSRCA